MGDQAERNYRWARALLDGLAAAGLDRVVISPGSRSTPLALAALRHPALTCHVLVDERGAAFFALGLAKASGRPAAVVCTSGSAAANLHPAIVEADMARLPLVAITADRPPELHDCGANQTIDQNRMFGAHVRAFRALPPAEADPSWLAAVAGRLVGEALWPLPGPVHLNLPFREPLVPGDGLAADPSSPAAIHRGTLTPPPEAVAALGAALSGRPGAVVCGPHPPDAAFAQALRELAAAAGCPILADPLSNLRLAALAPHVVTRHDAFLRRPWPWRPEWLLRFGDAPVSRVLGTWIEGCGAERQVVVSAHPRWPDPWRRATEVVHAEPAALCRALAGRIAEPAPPAWLAAWTDAESRAEALAARMAPAEGRFLRAVLEVLPADALLFTGNSLAVRALDWFMAPTVRPLAVAGNRGASGIDGNLATFLGMAAARGGPAVAVLGDLAVLHDLNSLAAAAAADAVLVVLNNGGGGIFDHLPQATLPEYERGWLTPQPLDLAHAAAAFGLRHRRLAAGAEAAQAVAEALGKPGVDVVEITVDRAASLEALRAYWSAVTELG